LISNWKIHKFGGSSLADADCSRRVARLLLTYSDSRMGVVVSAMGGMTDALLNLAMLAERDDDGFNDELHAMGERYSESARALVVQGPGAGPEVTAGGVFSDLLRLAKYLSEGD